MKSWKCVSERIVVVKVARVLYTLVQAYAPTDNGKSEDKDQFYMLRCRRLWRT